MTPPIQLVVFDLMGTLVDDPGIVDAAYETALVDAGLTLRSTEHDAARARVETLRGRPTLVVLTEVLGDPVRAEEATWAFDDSILAVSTSLQAVDGAGAVLDDLAAAGVHLAVTTSFSPEVRRAILSRLGWSSRFDVELSAHGRRRGHPAPDLLLQAILELGVDSVGQVAVVGDSVADLEAGNRAGAGLVIGVRSGPDGADRLASAPHTHLVDSVTEVPAIIDAPRSGGHRRSADR